ncbi:phage tail sheath family protein [Paeniglutamicibacter cryotolerans]|uniref:Phage tail sheath protein FI n=1 Tax=Paeniglutamicibacter cryotolerans TaxID=670079 RepID=A0A839QTU2_9MICC|nr:phage tail sheath family protein [Paeniglutamicibacter cryotolerans]MBB2997386.1 phage tail sheath protein FI [Paeniglutamicibacter cryotolerans]
MRIQPPGISGPVRPNATATGPDGTATCIALTGGGDGEPITAADLATEPGMEEALLGIYALDRVDALNLMAIPPPGPEPAGDPSWPALVKAAGTYCATRRAILILDPPATWTGIEEVQAAAGAGAIPRDADTALYFPRVLMPDPLSGNQPAPFGPSGVMAGIMARTDATRGAWGAPAGIQATLSGVTGLEHVPTDAALGRLAQAGIKALHLLPGVGPVAWGARTTIDARTSGPEWKYLPLRRLALHLEQSILAGRQWAALEPAGETLRKLLRLEVTAFMQDLFIRGAFQASTPNQAYFVRCGADTTTPEDATRGEANVIVGFASLKTSEFMLLRLVLRAGRAPGG